MNIVKDLQGDKLTISIDGRLNTVEAPLVAAEITEEKLSSVKELVWDFEKLEYISSAGLRVLLAAQKIMNQNGSMVLKHVSESVIEVFEITGFINIMTIED